MNLLAFARSLASLESRHSYEGQMFITTCHADEAVLVLGTPPGGANAGRRIRPMNASGTAIFPDDREPADAKLLTRVARGDRDSFGHLYDRFSRPLYSVALRIVQDPAEAQDIVHDAFVAVWEKAATFESQRGTAFSWLVALVRHRAIDRIRGRRRRAELLDSSVPADLGYDEPGQSKSADDHAAAGDDAEAVRTAVAMLVPNEQRALELAFFGGLTQEEVARALGEPLGTIKARIRRGLLKLREILSSRP